MPSAADRNAGFRSLGVCPVITKLAINNKKMR